MEDRKEITLAELEKGQQDNGVKIDLGQIEVKGIVTIIDKDGKVKSNLPITSLELPEE